MRLPFTTLIRVVLYSIWGALTRPRFPDYDPDDVDGMYRDPHSLFKRMKKERPIFFSEKMAAWVVTDPFQTVLDIFRDDRFSLRFSDWKFAPKIPEHKKNALDRMNEGLLMSMKKEDHMRVRKLAAPAFSPRMIEKIRGDIEAITNSYLDKLEENEPFDFCEISKSVPLEVVARFIGVPKTYSEPFTELSNAILASYMPTITVDEKKALGGLEMLRQLVADKKQNPKDDFLSVLITTVEDGDKISEEEALALIGSVLAAGPDTTRDYMNFVVRALVLHPDAVTEMLKHKNRLPDYLLEAFRWDTFGHGGGVRFALQDVEINGHTVHKGEMVRFMACATYHDEEVFKNPEIFDVNRPNKEKIIRYGVGNHYCLGAALANTITETVVWTLFSRFPHLEIVRDATYEKHFISRRMTSLMLKGRAK